MHTTSSDLNQLILDQLAAGEMRLLVLTVAIRKSLGVTAVKGDLSAKVQSALRALVTAKTVVNHDGTYSLPR